MKIKTHLFPNSCMVGLGMVWTDKRWPWKPEDGYYLNIYLLCFSVNISWTKTTKGEE